MDKHIQAQQLKNEGKSLRAIAVQMGVSKSTVANLLKKPPLQQELPIKEKSWLNPRWTQIQGGYEGPVDVFGAVPAPTVADLLHLNEDSVYFCVDWCAKSVAKTPLRVLATTSPQQKAPRCRSRQTISRTLRNKSLTVHEVLDHPLVELIEHPNREMSKYDFLYYIDSQLSLTGNAYVHVVREDYEKDKEGNVIVNEGLPVGLYPLLTQFVTQQADKGHIVGYTYGLPTPPITYPKKDVVHFKFINHENPYAEGYGPVRAVYERILLSKNELAYLLSLFRNQARPDIGVAVKDATDDQCERLQKELSMRFSQGGIGGPWVFNSEDFTINQLQWSPKDVLGTELYKWVKLQIINAFSLNPALFDTESSNRAVATQAKIMAQEQAIEPRCRMIEEKLNHTLSPEFDDRLVIEFESPVEADQDFDLQKRKDYLAAGVYTVDEVRAMEGLPAKGLNKE